ncbi:MAG: hypothetical protein A2509_00590 [Candidatus Edwardsbacteria bacterium RIFOXYD12_FULL_50_11]|uniref:Secretion system C-terminal sorting domain-containing protein n=1 Tax=Candidatus Edwardsbacteria bacterium GWF2_54_11 TaxID=1817851 RepID=A0A1F5RH31_9BACT|nr:MAG: hypothetical protein A2502_00820 [Candidatus Edwardsbacteria bacterium RifOxyC12_full_54_24]OGF06210.1 MAG: hypothetical protein A2273_11645 [Candidatus Edwardsbacteria bacterium RifOxyA12_full_54_48]OGF12524.1 MAG: hypothetical protein A3K15_01625 [Candidatus Edwardsbacteria bacterium GWE2_54_12]OGF13750.1 MAG: hypothetical protein A2024_11140 [Candidatus Edwardsbacteria bacterium GWF2_54_11]OGF17637.1 MAG: hypothetical protein A2509_00590 [Candidatus Edwardsbacteria bacterium RIFOXYD1
MLNIKLNILAVIIVLFFANIVSAWSPPYNISKNDTALVSCSRPCIAADKNGKAHVVWEAWRYDNYWGPHWVMYSSGKDTNWSTPIWLSNDTPSVSSLTPNIVVDTSGRPFVGWSDEGSGNIYFSYHNGSNWTTPQAIANQGGGHSGLRMAVDKQNNIHATWHSYADTFGVFYSRWNWSDWSAPVEMAPDSNIKMGWPDIAIDSYGNPHIIAMDYRNSLGYPLAYFQYNGVGWQKMLNPPDTSTGQTCYPRISIGLNDTIHLVWEERYGGSISYYTCGKNNLWSTPRRLMDSLYSYEPGIVTTNKMVYCAINPANKDSFLGVSIVKRDSFGQWTLPMPIIEATRCALLTFYTNKFNIYTSWSHSGWIEYSYDTVYVSGIQNEINPSTTISPPLLILKDIYPNPFKIDAKIVYALKNADNIILNIYNLAGQLVKSRNCGFKKSGTHKVTITADSSLSSGVYFYKLKLKSGKYATPLKKFIIIR